MYEKAIELDPKCADAYVGLAWTYFSDAWNGWIESPEMSSKKTHPDLVESQERALNRASEIVQKAIALDDSLPSAYVLLSQIDMYRGHYDQGIANAERAIALDPNSALSYFFLADALDITGKPEEAIATLNKAMRLDPLNHDFYLVELASAYTIMSRYAEAVPLLKRHLARYPNDIGGHLPLALSYVELGRLDDARAEVAEIMRIAPQFTLVSCL
jgi:adenylate cyclase